MPPDLLANSCLWYSAPTFGDRILPRGGGGGRERALCQFCPTTEESLKNALGCSKHDHSVNPSLTEGCNRALINTPFRLFISARPFISKLRKIKLVLIQVRFLETYF
jgi:hypothetical protein